MGNSLLTSPITNKSLKRQGTDMYRVGLAEMQGFRVTMEDQHTICFSPNGQRAFFGVYDGHSGRSAADFLGEQLCAKILALPELTTETITNVITKLDAEFLQGKDGNEGSTCLCAVVEPGETSKTWKITIAHVGDSRAVLIRDGKCMPLTTDHKPSHDTEHARIEAAGGYVSGDRVDGTLAMSRAFGDRGYKNDPTRSVDKQRVVATPDVVTIVAKESDMLLLCCDGLVECLSNDQVVQRIVAECKSRQTLLDDPARVVANVLDKALASGSKDNMTAMLVQFVDGRAYARPNEYVLGRDLPKDLSENDRFTIAFKADALRHGIQENQLRVMVNERRAEDNLTGKDDCDPVKDECDRLFDKINIQLDRAQAQSHRDAQKPLVQEQSLCDVQKPLVQDQSQSDVQNMQLEPLDQKQNQDSKMVLNSESAPSHSTRPSRRRKNLQRRKRNRRMI
jgi:protein phosphatase